jgi:ATP-dependent protease ClpP protease subunit
MKKRNREQYESDSEDGEEEFSDVVRSGTDIYFTGDVTDESVTKFNITLSKIEKSIRKRRATWEGYNPVIKVYIRSEGGNLFAGFSAMDHIKGCRYKVKTIADGVCCSAATFMLIAGDVRVAKPTSMVLIHQMSTAISGKYEELRDEMVSNDKCMEMMKKIYKKYTKIPPAKLKTFMTKDVYLDAEECLALGVVDEIACR